MGEMVQMEKVNTNMLLNASHDIRTSMNAIQGFTQMLKDNAGDEQKVRKIAGKMEKAGDTLMKLLNDVLELSRIESGKEELEPIVVDLNAFSEKIAVMYAEDMKEAEVAYECENRIQDHLIMCDEGKLTQIVENMLSNAIKFTLQGGKIVFGMEQLEAEKTDSARFRFYVKDTGVGMSKEFLADAFERFEKERTVTESNIPESGLGLSVIKKLTELMGGSCSLKSEVGEGTEIEAVIEFRLSEEGLAEQKKKEPQQVDFSGKRVLLVEDNEFNREVAKFILEKRDILVEEAENGYVALLRLMALGAGYFDLILMDIHMPVMDGYRATKEIRNLNNEVLSSIPIIAMTADAYKEDQQKCIEAGMNKHLSKPIDAEALMQAMEELLF